MTALRSLRVDRLDRGQRARRRFGGGGSQPNGYEARSFGHPNGAPRGDVKTSGTTARSPFGRRAVLHAGAGSAPACWLSIPFLGRPASLSGPQAPAPSGGGAWHRVLHHRLLRDDVLCSHTGSGCDASSLADRLLRDAVWTLEKADGTDSFGTRRSASRVWTRSPSGRRYPPERRRWTDASLLADALALRAACVHDRDESAPTPSGRGARLGHGQERPRRLAGRAPRAHRMRELRPVRRTRIPNPLGGFALHG